MQSASHYLSPWSPIQFSFKLGVIVALLLNCCIGLLSLLSGSSNLCSVNFILALAGLHSAPPTKHIQIWRIKIARPFAVLQQWRKFVLTAHNFLFSVFLINSKICVGLFCCVIFFFNPPFLLFSLIFLFYLVNVVVI